MTTQTKKKGGKFKGKSHDDGGISMVVPETGQHLEVEGEEPLISGDALQDKTSKTYKGTNEEILDEINRKHGAKGMNEKATEIHAGDAVVCKVAMKDKNKKKIKGSNKQVVSAINTEAGCKVIEQGATIEDDKGKKKQFDKGGEISEAELKARWNKKKEAITEMCNQIKRLRANLTRDLKSNNEKTRLTALVVSVMDKTAERVGNEKSKESGHLGITGLEKKNINIIGNKVHLDYRGKSGVDHTTSFSSNSVSKQLKKAIKTSPDKNVFTTSDGFKVKADRVNRYLKKFNITTKDMRGYSSNKWMVDRLKNVTPEETEYKRKRQFNTVLKKVAEKVGHTPATLRKHYLLPEVADDFVTRSKVTDLKNFYKDGGEIERGKNDDKELEGMEKLEDVIAHLYKEHHEVWDFVTEVDDNVCASNCSEYSQKVTDRWDKELEHHFEEEERILFPMILTPRTKPAIDELLTQHKEFKQLISKIRKNGNTEDIKEFCDKLISHIRLEESLFGRYLSDPYRGQTGITWNPVRYEQIEDRQRKLWSQGKRIGNEEYDSLISEKAELSLANPDRYDRGGLLKGALKGIGKAGKYAYRAGRKGYKFAAPRVKKGAQRVKRTADVAYLKSKEASTIGSLESLPSEQDIINSSTPLDAGIFMGVKWKVGYADGRFYAQSRWTIETFDSYLSMLEWFAGYFEQPVQTAAEGTLIETETDEDVESGEVRVGGADEPSLETATNFIERLSKLNSQFESVDAVHDSMKFEEVNFLDVNLEERMVYKVIFNGVTIGYLYESQYFDPSPSALKWAFSTKPDYIGHKAKYFDSKKDFKDWGVIMFAKFVGVV